MRAAAFTPWLVGLLGCTASHAALVRSATPSHRSGTSPALPGSWATAFERRCLGSITPPLVSPDSTRLVYCDAIFDLPNGRYLGRAPLGVMALLSADDAVWNDFSGRGPRRGRLRDGADGGSGAEGSSSEALAVNARGDRVASVEREAPDRLRLHLRSLPEWKDLDSAAIVDASTVGFLADGRVLALAGGAVVVLDAGALRPLGSGFGEVAAIAVAASGTRAVLTRRDGGRVLVALPSGDHLLELGSRAADRDLIALDPAGTRLAYVASDAVMVVDVRDASHPRAVHVADAANATGLQFTPDGRSLLVDLHQAVQVLRDDGPVREPPTPTYTVDLPPGFRAAIVRDHQLTFSRFEDYAEAVPPGLVARYRDPDVGIDVTVTAGSASEFGPVDGELAAWAHLVMGREGSWAQPPHLRSWRTGDGRALEYVYFQREGCEPLDRYVRFDERGELLYRIEVDVPPGTAGRRVAPLLTRFFDEPTGGASGARAFARGPRRFRGGC